MSRGDRAIGLLLGLVLGITIVILFVFLGGDDTIDAPSIEGNQAPATRPAADPDPDGP